MGSREQLLQLLAGTVLSVAVVAATAWWASTTRRVWKRWLNIAIAALAVANVLLGFVEFGYRQAAGAVAIVAGALADAAAARRALRPSTVWTAPRPPTAGRLRSPTGDPTAAGGVPARPGRRGARPRRRGARPGRRGRRPGRRVRGAASPGGRGCW